MVIAPMPPGCPWSELTNLWLPNIKWCEEQVCGLVVEPANTWSNLAYLILGLLLWVQGRRRGDRARVVFGQAELVVGVFSFAFHMSWSGILQVLDFAAMFVFVGLTLSLNLVRLRWVPRKRWAPLYLGGVLSFTALVVGLRFTSFPIQLVTPVLIVLTAATELLLWARSRREPARPHYRVFVASLTLLLAGAAFSALDAARVFCDPHDHLLQGHAIWHLLSALSLAVIARFYATLPESPLR